MSGSMAASMSFVDEFDFAYPYDSIESTPSPPMPSMDFSFDPSLLGLDIDLSAIYQQQQPPHHHQPQPLQHQAPYTTPKQQRRSQMTHSQPTHTRSSSRASVYSAVSTVESTPESVCTRATTPPRASTPIRHHGPILLPKIRSQDQNIGFEAPVQQQQHQPVVTLTPPQPSKPSASHHSRSHRAASHSRSQTNPETLSNMALAHMSFSSQPAEDMSSSLLFQPATFATRASPSSATPAAHVHAHGHAHTRRSSSVDTATIEKYGYPTYRQMPIVHRQLPEFSFPQTFAPRAPSPLGFNGHAASVTPEPVPSTTLMNFLTAPNPAASLVRTVNYPYRDPHVKHFWWDVRTIRSWSTFNAAAILTLPGASALLTTPVPAPVLPTPSMTSRHPETEAALHAIYASYYLPKVNAALALANPNRPLQLSIPSAATRTLTGKAAPGSSASNDLLFTANVAGEAATAAAMFGGKPSARVVGLVRTFDRFNTGMRAEGNIKRVEYLRGLAAIHHAMREHGCRYGFILTEIELVLVRNGTEATPFFGDLEITSVQLVASSNDDTNNNSNQVPLTACLALWGLCQLAANDQPQPGHASWRSDIGAPAEGTRRKAQPRDKWMPAPQLAEKREAKRSRGWVWPEDAVGRKELGKRGVRYGGV